MKRSIIASTAVALVLLLAAVSSVSAADPTDDPFATAAPDPSGEIVIDPTFIAPEPTATPRSEVQGATGRPQRTPPPTDTVGAPSQAPGMGLELLLLLGVTGSTMVLIAGRLPVARRG